MKQSFIRQLSAPDATDASRVGPKAANLAALTRAGLPTPGGFCVTADAYQRQIAHLGLADIVRHYAEANAPAQRRLAVEIRLKLYQEALAPDLHDEILSAWGAERKPAAVRSSALIEDRANGNFALPLSPESAFDLFTAVGEQRWVPGWSPQFLGNAEPQEPGLVFVTGNGAERTIWIVLESSRENRRLKYARVTPASRAGTVEVRLSACGDGTLVEVEYDLTALSSDTIRDLEPFAPTNYSAMMQQWKDLIGQYLGVS